MIGGGGAFGVSLFLAAMDYWLWRQETIGGTFAAWMGIVCGLLAAKGIEQWFLAWHLNVNGPRCLRFRRDDRSVQLEGFRGRSGGLAERIVTEVRNWQHKRVTGQGFESRKEYTLLLIVNGESLDLGTFAAEAAANQLSETISGFIGIERSQMSEEN